MVKKPKQPARQPNSKSKSRAIVGHELIRVRSGPSTYSTPPVLILFFLWISRLEPAGGVIFRFRARIVLLSDFSKQPAFHLPWRMASGFFR